MMRQKEKISLYRGFPLTAKATLETLLENGTLIPIRPENDGWYYLDEGVYSCCIEGENLYHILKVFVLHEPEQVKLTDLVSGTMMALNEDGSQDGWQPTGCPALAPENFRRDQRDMMLCIWPNSLLEKFGGSEAPKNHQILTQKELIERLMGLEEKCEYMKLYSLGKTKHLGFDLPLAVFSTEEGMNTEEKVTVWYQAQVHGNEPASCDGALKVMERVASDAAFRRLLDYIHPHIRELSLQLCGNVFSACKSAGLTINHFGTTAKSSIGRMYFGLHHCLSFLIETRGIGAGKYFYDRRVEAQVTAVGEYLKIIAEHAGEIKKTVKNARRLQDQQQEVILQQETSGETLTVYKGMDIRYSLDGKEMKIEQHPMALEDQIIRQRKKPSAYILSSALPNIDLILQKAKNMGIKWNVLPEGAVLTVRQYHNLGVRLEAKVDDDILAERRPAEERHFTEPMYAFPTDQPQGTLLALLMEPDVTDSAGTKATLFQQNLLNCEDIFCVE